MSTSHTNTCAKPEMKNSCNPVSIFVFLTASNVYLCVHCVVSKYRFVLIKSNSQFLCTLFLLSFGLWIFSRKDSQGRATAGCCRCTELRLRCCECVCLVFLGCVFECVNDSKEKKWDQISLFIISCNDDADHDNATCSCVCLCYVNEKFHFLRDVSSCFLFFLLLQFQFIAICGRGIACC